MWLKALRSTTSASLPLPIFFVFRGGIFVVVVLFYFFFPL